MDPFIANLIANLKAFNAKERDHLMRLAYLGTKCSYEKTQRWLSEEMISKLDPYVGEGTKCVFAAMDYHLDWLHVALLAACEGIGLNRELERDLLADKSCTDPKLQAVIGIQEDVDLLAVFSDDQTVDLLLIEAKGDAAFNRVQLARKLVRINRILMTSGANARGCLRPKLVLMGTERPTFPSSLDFARGLPGQYRDLRNELESHESGIGGGEVRFIQLEGFPKDLKMVKRLKSDGAAVPGFTRWSVVPR